MTGQLVGAAPWTREAIRQYRHRYPDAFAELEASIPDGMSVVLTSGGRYGSWGAVLMGEGELGRATGCATITAAVGAAVHAGVGHA